jgi:two-component system, NtrC family, response regulator
VDHKEFGGRIQEENKLKSKLLIIDDDDDIRSQMKWGLMDAYEIVMAEDRPKGVELFKQHRPDVVLLDLGLPPNPGNPKEGFSALGELLGCDAMAKVIIITGQGEKEIGLQAIGQGAYDFMIKPVEMEELKIILKRASHVARLEREYREIKEKHREETFEGMLGSSAAMQQVFASIRKVATTDAPVLILGESGTGKEMTAVAIHRRSERKDGPFIAINCGAIPENLLESELFGHEKGAFTGAHVQRVGRVEMATGGTLFLDEIGELPPPLQVKLLRFLQEQRIERVGGRKEIQVDTRVIAATNIDLARALSENRFREDLYYRLAVVTLKLPPLRERGSDAVFLAKAFLQKFSAAGPKGPRQFDKQALRAMELYHWPGNVRELENRVKRASIMAEGARVTVLDLELPEVSTGNNGGKTLKEAREDLERQMIEDVLRKHGGKISPAALELGISRPTFYELLEKLGISRS